MTLKQVNNWDTDNPDKLGRQLSTFEDDVAAEANSIRSGFVPLVQAVRFHVVSPRTIYRAQFGQWISTDTTAANGTIVLPPVDPRNVGKRLCIFWLPLGAHTLTLVSQSATDTINNIAGPHSLAFNLTQVFLDYSGYWVV